MDFVLQKTASGSALKPGTLLHDRYRIISIAGMDEHSITYEAGSDGSRLAIREFFPSEIASRNGNEVVYDAEANGKSFRKGMKDFTRCAKVLQKGLPHFAPVTEILSGNNTTYAISAMPDGKQLSALSVTATYVQSLGVMLCESFAALHAAKLYYGMLREEHLHFSADGILELSPAPIRTSGSEVEDMHCLTAFLETLLPEEDDDEAAESLRSILQRRYSDAQTLKAALTGGKPAGRHGGILCLLVCLFFLAAGIFLMQQVPERTIPLSGGLESGKITPEVITVWLPLPENADEASVCAMYERLAAGFERQNPGCGVNILIYADDSFGEALERLEESEHQPAVFMDVQKESVPEQAASLSTLTASLENVYMTDLNRFDTAVPLACSVPVLYYNSRWMKPEESTLGFGSLPENTQFDVSAADFISRQNTEQAPAECFAALLEGGKNPVLASSSLIAEAEHSGISSGAVRMLPVTTAGGFPLQFEMLCAVNRESDLNSQRVGMLWLQYLLTEESQQVLFVEHYGDLPLHRTAFESAVAAHSGFAPLSEVKPEAPAETIGTEVTP